VEKGEVGVKFEDVNPIGTPRCSRNSGGFESGTHDVLDECSTRMKAQISQ
jgi:hypothetical protein